MLLVLAGAEDRASRRLVEEWSGEARLLTCRDLSTRGWRYRPGSSGGTAMIGQRPVRAAEIEAVVTRLPCVSEGELGWIAAEDRSYVAAEMNAFLVAWLSALSCPVLNRPSPIYLMGPYWHPEQWLRAASELGMAVVSARRAVPSAPDDPSDPRRGEATTVTVVGGRTLGDVDPALAAAAVALADAAGVELLRARFAAARDEPAFLDADYWVDLADPAVVQAISAVLAGARAS
jgi:hypothetical protein